MKLLKLLKLLKSFKLFKFNFCVALLLLVTFSSATRSNTFLIETYVGVINIHPPKTYSKIITGTGVYLLHTTKQSIPLRLVFKHGQPDNPIMTGDKVEVVGLNAAGKLFVQRIESLPNNSIPF